MASTEESNRNSSCQPSDLPCLREQILEMQSLLLTVTLCVLVAVFQAQDDLPFLSDEEKVRQGGMVDGCMWKP